MKKASDLTKDQRKQFIKVLDDLNKCDLTERKLHVTFPDSVEDKHLDEFRKIVEGIAPEKEDSIPDPIVIIYNMLVGDEFEEEEEAMKDNKEQQEPSEDEEEKVEEPEPEQEEEEQSINFDTAPPFENLFPIDSKVYEAIKVDMEKNGYDQAQPVVMWKEKGVVLDGHTRIKAARELGLFADVTYEEKSFDSEEEALEYAIHNQRDRRNFSEEAILNCIEAVDKRKNTRGRTKEERKKKIENFSGNSLPDTASETAKTVGISRSKVTKTRTVLDHATDEQRDDIKKGKKTIHKVSQEIKDKKKPSKRKKKPQDEYTQMAKAFKKMDKAIEDLQHTSPDDLNHPYYVEGRKLLERLQYEMEP